PGSAPGPAGAPPRAAGAARELRPGLAPLGADGAGHPRDHRRGRSLRSAQGGAADTRLTVRRSPTESFGGTARRRRSGALQGTTRWVLLHGESCMGSPAWVPLPIAMFQTCGYVEETTTRGGHHV